MRRISPCSKSRAAALHERIAGALTSRFPEIAKRSPELVAEHFSAAGRVVEAGQLWLQAAHAALGRAANHEAIIHVRRGLELVSELPEADRNRQELDLLMVLIPALIAAAGWASPELDQVYRRAAELVNLLPETPHRFTVLTGTMSYHFVAGRVPQSLGLAGEVYELATRIGDPLLLTIAHQCYSAARRATGDFRGAVESAEAGLAMLDVERERAISRMLGLSSCAGLLFYEASSLWMLGFPERGMQAAERCVALASEIGHPPTIAFSYACMPQPDLMKGDAEAVIRACDQGLEIVRKERLGYYEPTLTVYRGWGESQLGASAKAAGLMRDATERYAAAGNGIHQVLHYTILADVQWKSGQRDDALRTLESAMALAKKNGERLFEPQLYRQKGDFLFALSAGATGSAKLAEAEACIRESLDLARSQEAKMLELRSLVSLCRVRREIGVVSEEREALRALHDSFTEGFDTHDLREARAIVDLG